MGKHSPFRARFFILLFTVKIKDLQEERVIATLLGCIDRRIKQSIMPLKLPTPRHVNRQYNEEQAACAFKSSKEHVGQVKGDPPIWGESRGT